MFAAWRLIGRASEWAVHTTLIVRVDAVTGEVVSVESGVMHGDEVSGVVEGGATSGIGPPYPGDTVTVPLAEAPYPSARQGSD